MKEWIIPCNSKFYDVKNAFANLQRIDWKQSAKSIGVGDIVFIYVGKPIQAIMYKCVVNKTNLYSIEIDDSAYVINGKPYSSYKRHMELELIGSYHKDDLSFFNLTEKGLKGCIQGPRTINFIISKFINEAHIY